MSKIYDRYGEVKSLCEILEELSLYCYQSNCGSPTIKIILPKKVLEYFSSQFRSKERIVLAGEPPPLNPNYIKSLTTFAGKIELFNDEDNEVTTKDKV